MMHLMADSFPRSNAYHPDWVMRNASGGANSLWLTEWLSSKLDLRPGMRVLDLGCGRGCSSIFLAREFGLNVWATDLWFSCTENFQRIQDAGVSNRVFPIHADARQLPFAAEFFDAILCIDAFAYFGTDDWYLPYLARFVKPGGVVAIAGSGFVSEIDDIPDHLSDWIRTEPSILSLHSAAWWKKHWERSAVVDVEFADQMVDGWRYWLDWQKCIAPENRMEIQSLEADQGSNLTYLCVVGRRRTGIELEEPIMSIPASYLRTTLLRSSI